MKIADFLTESIDFWVPDAPRANVVKDCFICHGSGKDSGYSIIKNNKNRKWTNSTDSSKIEREIEKYDKYLKKLENLQWSLMDYTSGSYDKQVADVARQKMKALDIKIDNRYKRIKQQRDALINNAEFKQYDCGLCNGTGKDERNESEAPSMNVSNANASVILNMLGIEFDYGGSIPVSIIPGIKRRLIKLKNQGIDQYTRDTTVSQTDHGMKKTKDHESGITTIAPSKGPTMIDVGLSASQIESYVERIMPILDYAQEHNMDVGWG